MMASNAKQGDGSVPDAGTGLTPDLPSPPALSWLQQSLGPKGYAYFWISCNIVASISIVFCNKALFQYYNFRYGTTLTFCHFTCITLMLYGARVAGVFHPKPRPPLRSVLPLAITFAGFVVGTNVSLALNSVGLFQILKIVNTPVAALLQLILLGTRLDRVSVGALILVCIGAGITSVTDVSVNTPGLIVGLSAVLCTVAYQMLARSRQRSWEFTSLELLYTVAPVAAGILLIFIPILDGHAGNLTTDPHSTLPIGMYTWTAPSIILLLLSCSIALVVNVSMFMTIRLTSVVSYNVIGHTKTCAVLLGGFVFFSSTPTWRNTVGILITLAGVFAYSHLRVSKELGKAAGDNGGVEERQVLASTTPSTVPRSKV